MKILKYIFVLLIGILIGYLLFKNNSNSVREYNESGDPKNCRALIYENEFDFHITKKYTHEDLLKSIFRNCGETGSLWAD